MRYYTAEETAKKLKVSKAHVYELVKRGQLKKKEGIGRTIRIPSNELEGFKQSEEIFQVKKCFKYDSDKIELVETYLGSIRKIKSNGYYILMDVATALGYKDSNKITKVIEEDKNDRKFTEVMPKEEAMSLGLYSNQYGITIISYQGIYEYALKTRKKLNWNRFLKELQDNSYEQVEFKEEPKEIANIFEGHKVNIIVENGEPLFEVYSTGMALGYVKTDVKNSVQGVPKKYVYPYKSRIDKTLENAEIKPAVKDGQQYLTESQLYDFMLEARTEKCKSFRKWITNEVLPTIRKTGGYVDNSDKFVDNYFTNLSPEVRQAIKQELINRNKVLISRKQELLNESKKLKSEYDSNNKVIEQLDLGR